MGEHLKKVFVVVEDRVGVFAKDHVKALSKTVSCSKSDWREKVLAYCVKGIVAS